MIIITITILKVISNSSRRNDDDDNNNNDKLNLFIYYLLFIIVDHCVKLVDIVERITKQNESNNYTMNYNKP